MWVSKAFISEREARVTAEAESGILKQQNAVLRTQLEWLVLRVTQLEKERAQLLFNYTGVKVEFPVVEQETKTSFDPMAQIPDFNDMGDALAKAHGIAWDSEGRVVYNTPKK